MNRPELLVLVVVIAVAVNLPFGAWRTTTRKFSWQWFLSIHLPIPAIFVIRRAAGFGWDYVPVMVACAVTGQLLGGWLYQKIRPSAHGGQTDSGNSAARRSPTDAGSEVRRAQSPQIDPATALAADVERVSR